MQFLYFTVHWHLGKLSSTASMVLLLILSSLVLVIKVISSGIPTALTQLQPPSWLRLLRERGRKKKDGSFISLEQENQASPILNFIQLFFQQPLDLKKQIKMAAIRGSCLYSPQTAMTDIALAKNCAVDLGRWIQMWNPGRAVPEIITQPAESCPTWGNIESGGAFQGKKTHKKSSP